MTRFNFSTMDGSIERRARAAHEHGKLEKPTTETMACPCGHSGPPEAIVRHSEWDLSETDRDTFICPECGSA